MTRIGPFALGALQRITALDEALNRALFHRALKVTRLAKLPAVALHALPEEARAGVTGAVHASSSERIATLRACLPLAWFALPSHTERNAPAPARRDRNAAYE